MGFEQEHGRSNELGTTGVRTSSFIEEGGSREQWNLRTAEVHVPSALSFFFLILILGLWKN